MTKPSNPVLIETINLSCGFESRTVLTNLNFTWEVGEVVALLGPNGSGKTTLFNTLTGRLAPLSGEVKIRGKSIKEISPRELGLEIGFVPQNEVPVFPFSVRDVVLMGRMVHDDSLWERPLDIEKAHEAMALADCLDLADRDVTQLSGGEWQRVLLARCLAQESPLVMLDEPTSHSDFAHQVGLAEVLCNLVGQGRGVVLALHDLNQALLMATRCMLLSEGSIVADGSPRDVLVPDLLKKVYGCSFERVEDPSGQIRVFPVLG